MNEDTKPTGISKLVDVIVESLASGFASIIVVSAKLYHSVFPPRSADLAREQQEHAEFFSLAKIAVNDVAAASRAITDLNADSKERLKRALSTNTLVNDAEKKVKASYFRTPENLKKAHSLILRYLTLTRDYCDLLTQAFTTHTAPQGTSTNWSMIKSTHAQSMSALYDLCEELENFAQVMNQKASDLAALADDTEKLAKETLKQDMKEIIKRRK